MHKLIKKYHPTITFSCEGSKVSIHKVYKNQTDLLGQFPKGFARKLYKAFLAEGYIKQIY